MSPNLIYEAVVLLYEIKELVEGLVAIDSEVIGTLLHLWLFSLLRLWSNFITFMVGITFMVFITLIIKITISSIVIGFKNSYFPLIHLPSCYQTVCYWTVCYRTVQ